MTGYHPAPVHASPRPRSQNRFGVICGVTVAVLAGTGMFAVAYRFDHANASLRRQHREDQIRIAYLESNTKLAGLVRRAGQTRDRQDQRTQRLLCAVFRDVLRSPPSIGINVNGDDVSDCADRPSTPLVPRRSRP